MNARPNPALRALVRRSACSESPTGRAMPNRSPEPVGSAVDTTIQSPTRSVPEGAPADVILPPMLSIRFLSSSVCVYSLPSLPTANGISPRSRRVVVRTVASKLGRLTSAFAARTTLPSRSSVTSRRVPESAILRRAGACRTDAVGVTDGAGLGFGAGAGFGAGLTATAAAASAIFCASATRFCASAVPSWMPCAMPSMRWFTSAITRWRSSWLSFSHCPSGTN